MGIPRVFCTCKISNLPTATLSDYLILILPSIPRGSNDPLSSKLSLNLIVLGYTLIPFYHNGAPGPS